MIRGFFLIIIFVYSFQVNAQPGVFEEDIKSALDSTPSYWVNLQTANAFISGNLIQIRSIKGGLNYDGKLRFGLGYNWLGKTVDVDTEFLQGEVGMNYFSLSADYTYYKRYPWSFSIPVQLGLGYSFLKTEEDNSVVRSDFGMISVYEPIMMAQYHFLNYFSISGGIGFRLFVQNNKNFDQKFNSPIYVVRFGIDFKKLWNENKTSQSIN